MKKVVKLGVLALSVFALTFTACEKDNSDLENVSEDITLDDAFVINTNDLGNRTPITDPEILNTLSTLDIDAGILSRGDFHLPDGTIEERIFIGSDITFTLEEFDLLINGSAAGRQYRTINLVEGNNRTINILGFTGGNQGLSDKARTALQRAVANYNNLDITLQFNLTFGTNFQAADMVVFDNSVNNGGTGGVAGFPNSSGQPNKFVQIYGIEQFSTNVNEHVITHEIGHSIGFRHTDWFDRLSCPAAAQGNEGQGSDGAIQIPGTPSGRDLTSVMQACFSTSVSGNFNNNDITALEFMYPESSGSICDGVPPFQSNVNYSVGDRVTFRGNLFERASGRWTFIGPCN